MTPDTLDALVDVKREIAARLPKVSYNAPEYVLASDYDALRSSLARLTEANERLLSVLIPLKQRIYQGEPDGWIDHGINCMLGTHERACTCGLSDWIKTFNAAIAAQGGEK